METIAKVFKALFLSSDDEVDKTAVQKLKDGILWMLLGAGLLIGALYYFGDEDEDDYSEDDIEYVEEEDAE